MIFYQITITLLTLLTVQFSKVALYALNKLKYEKVILINCDLSSVPSLPSVYNLKTSTFFVKLCTDYDNKNDTNVEIRIILPTCFEKPMIFKIIPEHNINFYKTQSILNQNTENDKITTLQTTSSSCKTIRRPENHKATHSVSVTIMNDRKPKIQKYRLMSNSVLKVGILKNVIFDCELGFEKNELIPKGYSVDIIEKLQNIMKFKIEYIYADKLENENYSESRNRFLNLLLENKTDIALCHSPFESDSISNISYLYPTLQSSYAMIYLLKNLSVTQDIFVLTFSGTLWLCLLIALVILALALRYITVKCQKYIPQYEAWSWVEITLWAVAAACQQGLSYTPNGFPGRCVFFTGYVMCYLLYTSFAAGITSLLTTQTNSYKLTPKDIEDMNLNVIAFGNIEYLSKNSFLYTKSKRVSSLIDFFNEINSVNTVGIAPKVIINHYLSSNLPNINTCDYGVDDLPYQKISMAFAIRKNFNYAQRLNYWLMRLSESGALNHMVQKHLPAVPACEQGSAYSSVSYEHIKSAVIIMICGIATGLVFLIIECMWNFYKRRRFIYQS